MKNLEQQFSEDLLITHSSKPVREYSDPIPVDLLIDIFSRVPAKSIVRFRCVSKFWSSILGRPDFTDLFQTKSLTRPRLLFLLEFKRKLSVFSSPQPHQDPDEDSSLVATHYADYTTHSLSEFGTPLGGFISFDGRICNPVTGQSLTLPKGLTRSFFGYDPINKQIKVLLLRLTFPLGPNNNHHQVLILDESHETGNRSWRTIQDSIFPHVPRDDEICINGALYYTIMSRDYGVVCFDFVSEKFGFIYMDQDMLFPRLFQGLDRILFNYKGKLGAHLYLGGHREELVLWVLEDAEKHQWSKIIYRLPPLIKDKTKIVGMTGAGELVFSPHYPTEPFYIFYYNIERNTVRRVRIQGLKFNHPLTKVRTFLGYVENVKPM